MLVAIRRYYNGLDAALAPLGAFTLDGRDPPTVLVALEGRTRMTDRALQLAMTLSPDVVAIHLMGLAGPESKDNRDGSQMARWQSDIVGPLEARDLKPPRLLLLAAPFREIHGPMLDLIAQIDDKTPGRAVAVLIPELIKRHWWERLLHNNRAARLRKMLVEHGGPRVEIIISPWRR